MRRNPAHAGFGSLWPVPSLAFALLLVCAVGNHAAAQSDRTAPDALRRQVERRFTVFPVKDGLALRPKAQARTEQTIEVSGGDVVVNGVPVTGSELRSRLGAGDADLVLQLSYLDVAAQRRLFGDTRAPASPEPPSPPPERPSPPLERPSPEQPPQPPEPLRSRRSSDRVHIGGSVTVDADETIDGDVVAIGGSARVRGEVRGEVVAIGGYVELGPNAIVRKGITVVGGTVRRDPAARVDGEIREIGVGAMNLSGWHWARPSLATLWWGRTLGAAFALLATVIRVAVLCLLAALVILVGREYVERVSALAAAQPFKAGAIGFLAQVLFLPILIITVVLLVVTIVGIPLLLLLPFALLGLGAVGLIGFTAVGYHLGRLLGARLGWVNVGPYASTMAGILLLLSPLLLARLVGLGGGLLFPMTFGLGLIGILVEYLAWTIGFGAVALVRFGRPPASAAV
jgi:hypothetical protein